MGRSKAKIRYVLDTGDVKELSHAEIKMFLRAADEIAARGGRSMLTKILGGSRDKRMLELKLDKCPAYGYYSELRLDEVSHRVDWMLKQGYLKTEYSGTFVRWCSMFWRKFGTQMTKIPSAAESVAVRGSAEGQESD